MKEHVCQSCGMPLQEEILGSNTDGSKNTEFCMYCYDHGKYTYDCTLKEMLEVCVKPTMESMPGSSEAEVRKELSTFLPSLKRWK